LHFPQDFQRTTDWLGAAATHAVEADGAQVIVLTTAVREGADVSALRGRLEMTASAISGRTKKRGESRVMGANPVAAAFVAG
jgi:hypothetical protein